MNIRDQQRMDHYLGITCWIILKVLYEHWNNNLNNLKEKYKTSNIREEKNDHKDWR